MLTQISEHWFARLRSLVPNHLLDTALDTMPSAFSSHPEIFEGRSMLVRKTRPLPIECVVRGYLAGSAWKEYKQSADGRGRGARARLERRRPPRSADLHAGDEGRDGARREHHVREDARDRGPALMRTRCATAASRSIARPQSTSRARGSCSPTRSSSSAWSTARSFSSTRCCRPTLRATGTRRYEAGRCRRSTSSSCATGSTERLGSRAAGARAPAGGRREDARALPRRVPADHGEELRVAR